MPWTAWAAVLALALCGAAHLPVHRDGVPLDVLAAAFVLSGLCLLSALALVLVRRPALPLLGAAVPAAALFAAAQLLAGRVEAAWLPRFTAATLVPPWIAAPTAAVAVLTALLALLVRLYAGSAEAVRRP
ncbi:hypothetical protein OG562_40445 [Streptomyces sp. NBC_01275]|uniref:hypothetical protein n=1 Tax=Streptomyces sp. NBC_01275 TaxID=2903807 RepID=UPI0022501273|nr:hypothetical protein [Streptomyces sp. NBC_01275]MCX4767134.1 hypothetical protein [Streptomyces sp. NBC_01275]